MKDKKLSRMKHKRLDAICEREYSKSHSGVESIGASEYKDEGDEAEVRRSSRVRRAPVLLDTSPSPVKKRRRVGKGSGLSIVDYRNGEDEVNMESGSSASRDMEEGDDGWRARLRSRSRGRGRKVREVEVPSPRGKRKLFDDCNVMVEESISVAGDDDNRKPAVVGDATTVVKSKRPGRIHGSNSPGNQSQKIELGGSADDDKEDSIEKEVLEERVQEGTLVTSEIDCEADKTRDDDNAPPPSVDTAKGEIQVDIQVEKCPGASDVSNCDIEANVQLEVCHSLDKLGDSQDIQDDIQACNVGQDRSNVVEINELKSGCNQDKGDADEPLETKTFEKLKKKHYHSDGQLKKFQIKEGRKCGLCGTSSHGKPPRQLVQDGATSDNEAYSGSSSSEESNYDMLDGFGDEPGWLGRLLGPINDRHGIAGIWVHQQCAVWSPEVYFAGLGCLKNVRAALCRGRVLKCTHCGRSGATIGCRVDRCPRTYHLPCARANSCIFDHRKFLIACTDHRYMFQQGYQNVDYLKKMKVKKIKLELRKNSNDAYRKDVEAEEKWLENCGEDEEFLKRESKRLHRDLLRIAPTYIGGSSDKQNVECEGWESVAGLQSVIQCLKEVVILPLLYPEYFDNLGLTPPRGVLLHGYPGTGKTLVVRALIGSCARGDKKIAYFSRKGADCLGKYVGDAERQLRLLFQVAEKSQPSIIFFDEIDGLAPCRTPQQDQTHSSVVSTLLALMDGLKSRGSVIVIGATNRPDAIDPALRRPGRFDREIYFPLPSVDDREAILSLHTRNWPKPISGPLLKTIAGKTVGFAGADIQALCSQAAIIALRRSFPLQRILSEAANNAFNGQQRPPLPSVVVQERDWLEAFSCAAPPCSRREAGCAANELLSSPLPTYLGPCLLQPLSRMLVSLHLDERVWLPPPLSKAALLIENVIISASGKRKLNRDNWWSHATDVLEEAHAKSQIEDGLKNVGIIEGGTCSSSYVIQKDDIGDGHHNIELLRLQCARPGLLQNVSYDSRKKSGFRLLISGNPRSGQRHLASCLLHYFLGNIEVQKIDLATISQSGHGDMIQGLQQVLMRCASLHYCMIFMPRIDLWAMEVFNEKHHFPPTESESSHGTSCNGCFGVNQGDSNSNSEVVDTTSKASYLWNSFVEQVESISVNSSLTILATSEVQLSKLPPRIQQFFNVERINDKLLLGMGNSLPQFSVEISRSFEYERVFELCSVRLSKDLAQDFAQVMHYENHIHVTSFSKDNVSNVDEASVGGVVLLSDTVTESKQSPITTVSPTLQGNFPVKGKSSLLVAISTFGCQILLYPHFAELCWVTSKLKEGPCADISGPWKGWPFNSCIVRPVESSERNSVALVSNTTKVDKKFGIVRGLVAVGLSAFRGEYASLRQVASEVRKVLKLLVGHIEAKIQAGKDRHEYIRVMSQVAYLEDMVLSWAHTLQRFEADAQPIEGDLEINREVFPNNESSIKSPRADGDVALQDCTKGLLHESTVSEENHLKLDANGVESMGHPNTSPVDVLEAEKGESVDLDNSICKESVSGGLHLKHTSEASKNAEDATESAPGTSLVKNNVPPENTVQNINVCNETSTKAEDATESAPGASLVENNVPPENTVQNIDVCNEASKNAEDATESAPGSSLVENNVLPENTVQNIYVCNEDNCRASRSTPVPQSDIICFYRCCPECLINLHCQVKETLNQWKGTGKNSAIEDVHDFVSRISSKLHSALRRLPVPEKSCSLNEGNTNTISCPETRVSDNDTKQSSTQCHNRTTDSVATGTRVPPRGLELEFIFRNSVLTILDTNCDAASLHCKWETVCLCSLVELVKASKESSV